MPIDPNIILGIKPSQVPQLRDPMEEYGKSLTLKSLIGQSQDEDAVRSAYQQAGGDNARLRSLLQEGGQHRQIQALDKFDLEKRDKEASIAAHTASAGKSNFETQIGQIQHGSAILSTAKDQPSWDQARRVMSITFPSIASQLPEQFDPAFVQAKIAAGQTMAQKLAAEHAQQTMAETGRHNRAGEATAAGNLEVARGNLDANRQRLAADRTTQNRAPAGYRFTANGDMEAVPGGPADAKTEKKDTEVKRTLDMYVAAREGLMTGLEGSSTGALLGRVPAYTSGQQVAEGGVAAMAPVLKQLFRVSGEGVFTDRDQQLLLDMVPKRTDRPDARIEKMANIDRIVSAKLGSPVPKRVEKVATSPTDIRAQADAIIGGVP